jgi:hypothetical protein
VAAVVVAAAGRLEQVVDTRLARERGLHVFYHDDAQGFGRHVAPAIDLYGLLAALAGDLGAAEAAAGCGAHAVAAVARWDNALFDADAGWLMQGG